MSKLKTKWIEDAAITKEKLNSDVAGDGLSGGAGSALSVNVDNSTLEIFSDSLQVKSEGITESHLAITVAGEGLTGGGGSPLSVQVDDSSIEIATGVLRIKTGGVLNEMLAGGITDDKLFNTYINADGTTPLFGNWDLGGTFTITNVPNPTSDSQIANKSYVDSVAQGLDVKDSVRALADSNVTTSGTTTIDGVSLSAGDRVLLTGQTNGVENGIWVVQTGSWTRPDDFANGSSVAGAFTFVESGNTYADSGWVCTNDSGSDIVGTDSLSFSQFSGAGQITAGAGLTKTGNTLNVGQNSTGGIKVNADDIQLNVDNSTIEISGTDPGTVQVKAGGITGNHLSSSVAGAGLTGGGGNALSVNVDNSTIEIIADALQVKAGGITENHLNTSVAGNGLTGGGGNPLAVGAGSGITVNADSIEVNPADLISGGSAEIDGDKIDIDWNPSNYTPTTSPSEVDNVDQLTAHLAGIDNALAGISTENIYQEMHTITSAEETAGYFTLTHTPVNARSVRVDVVGGIRQINKQAVNGTGLTPDFDILNNNQLHFNNNGGATGLSGDLSAGDTLIICYQY